MEHVINEVPVTDGLLFTVTCGRRFQTCTFTGRIEIVELQHNVSILGQMTKGTKQIQASFIVCGDLDFMPGQSYDGISSAAVYEADGFVRNKKLHFSGLTFEDDDPETGELKFNIPDLELIRSLMAKS